MFCSYVTNQYMLIDKYVYYILLYTILLYILKSPSVTVNILSNNYGNLSLTMM